MVFHKDPKKGEWEGKNHKIRRTSFKKTQPRRYQVAKGGGCLRNQQGGKLSSKEVKGERMKVLS